MSLPAAWVESLFARLTIRYGAGFMRQYADLEPAAVKADWASVLGGFAGHPENIRYGLDNLPADKPPNAMQFRAICNGGPRNDPPAITNDVKAEPAKVAALVASIAREPATDLRAWAKALKAREEAGERLSVAQRDAWRRALVEGEPA